MEKLVLRNLWTIIFIVSFASKLFAQAERRVIQNKMDIYINSDNPFEEVGEKHNDGVKYVMSKLKGKKNISQDDVILATKEFLNDKVGDQVCLKLSPENGAWKQKNIFLFQNEIYSAFESSKNLQSFTNSIKSIETKILSNKSKTDDKKVNNTLIALSVARYSSFYWDEKGGNPQGKIKWLDKIKDDLEGAGTGAGVGVLIGGPGGAVIGGIAGAIIGSCCMALDIPIVIKNK